MLWANKTCRNLRLLCYFILNQSYYFLERTKEWAVQFITTIESTKHISWCFWQNIFLCRITSSKSFSIYYVYYLDSEEFMDWYLWLDRIQNAWLIWMFDHKFCSTDFRLHNISSYCIGIKINSKISSLLCL